MEITREQLIRMGFTIVHDDIFFPKLKKERKDPESKVELTKVDEESWYVYCYRCDEKGKIIKKLILEGIDSLEDLKQGTDLCGVII